MTVKICRSPGDINADPPQSLLHIAIIFHDFSPGGTERIAIRLASAWTAMGQCVTIYCGTEEGPLRVLVPNEVKVVGMSPPIRRSPTSRLRLGRVLAAHLGRDLPDIIFAPGNFHLPVLAALVKRLPRPRPKCVMKISNPLAHNGLTGWPSRAITRRLASCADAFVAMSPMLAEQARSILPSSFIRPIAEPNLDEKASLPRQMLKEENASIIIAAGRMVPQKDFPLAIRAFAALTPEVSARMIIFGEGEKRQEIEDLAWRCGVGDRVMFPGFIPDIRPMLAKARLFLLSSKFEGYPAVVVEALAAGVPVVATDCSPALRELISDPDFGEIVQDRRSKALAAAIQRQLSRPLPDAGKLAQAVSHNRITPSARAYLALFDELRTSD